MIKRSSIRWIFVILIMLLAPLSIPIFFAEAGGGFLIVNTTEDTDDGRCDAVHCTLREAINTANSTPGPQEIHFDILGVGPHHIELCTPLPSITDSDTEIDGTTAPGYFPAEIPVVVIEPMYSPGDPILATPLGPSCSATAEGLWIESSNNTIRGLSLVGFDGVAVHHPAAIVVNSGMDNLVELNYLGLEPSGSPHGNREAVMLGSSGQTVRNNVISGNFIGIRAAAPTQTIQGNIFGTESTGMTTDSLLANGFGVQLDPSAHRVLIGGSGPDEGNLISGSTNYGISIQSNENVIQGNLIGTNKDGNLALANLKGIVLDGDSNTIGGPNPGEGNTISGNTMTGIHVRSGHNMIQGNFIGSSADGRFSLGNGGGIWIQGQENQVGGGNTGEGNVISGNVNFAVEIQSFGNRIQGNNIGVNVDGSSIIPNGDGVVVYGFDTFIGGLDPAEGNIIAGSGADGIRLEEAGGMNTVLNNIIGTNLTGSPYMANYGVGIRIKSEGNSIGAFGVGNEIAYNVIDGITVTASDNLIRWNEIHHNDFYGVMVAGSGNIHNIMRWNSFYANGQLGIDLRGISGVDTNDPGDADGGGNEVLNYPVLTSISSGVVSGEACPGCIVDLYLADEHPTGHGEGKVFLATGQVDVNRNFQIPFLGDFTQPLSACSHLTALATDGSITGNTSEFAENVPYGFCLAMDPGDLILTVIVTTIIGVIIGGGTGRFTHFPAGLTTAAGGAAGLILGGGLLVIAVVSPNVLLRFPQPEKPGGGATGRLPPCETYLNLKGFSPPDGAVFETYQDPELSWTPLENLPEGELRWRVELQGPGAGEAPDRTTTETEMLFSKFGLTPSLGSVFHWRLAGEQFNHEDNDWDRFCLPSGWRMFQMGELPEPGRPPWTREPTEPPEPTKTPTPTPTPVCEADVVITALENLNCRAGSNSAFKILGTLFKGDTAIVEAFNPSQTWAYIENPSFAASYCWVWMGQAEVTQGDASCAPQRPDPTPPPTEPECLKTLPKDECEAAGGTWVTPLTEAPYCKCP